MITEDGTGTPGANSYASLTQANDYHADRLNGAWAASDDATRKAALIRATDYLEATYRAPGAPMTPGQALQWPTAGDTGIPGPVVAATLMLALYALAGPLSARASRGIKKSIKILDGVGESDTTYDDLAPADPYPAITSLLVGVATVCGDTGPGALTMGRLTR